MELRSIVDFLNKQMERSEVLLIEAKYYERDGLKIVVPSLFGFTEEARKVKKSIEIRSSGEDNRKWDLNSIKESIFDLFGQNGKDAFNAIIEISIRHKARFHFGSKKKGSVKISFPYLLHSSIFALWSDGSLVRLVKKSTRYDIPDVKSKEIIKHFFQEELEMGNSNIYANKVFCQFKFEDWRPHVDQIVMFLDDTLRKYQDIETS
jgi:hypothetical protein